MARPAKYKTPEEMQAAIDAYFEELGDELPTMTGLAIALGFTSRRALLNYAEKDEFVHTLKAGRMRVEHGLERELVGRSGSVTGLIFNLKNNFGWKDSQEHTHLTENEDGKKQPIGLVWPDRG